MAVDRGVSGSGKLPAGTAGNLAGIPRNTKKASRPYRGFMPLEAAESSAGDLGSSLQKLGFVPEAQNDMIFSIICEEQGLAGRFFSDPDLRTAFVEAVRNCPALPGSGRHSDLQRHHESHGDPGDPEHCGCDQHHPQYRNYTSFCKLRRNVCGVSSGGNGAGLKRKPRRNEIAV